MAITKIYIYSDINSVFIFKNNTRPCQNKLIGNFAWQKHTKYEYQIKSEKQKRHLNIFKYF